MASRIVDLDTVVDLDTPKVIDLDSPGPVKAPEPPFLAQIPGWLVGPMAEKIAKGVEMVGRVGSLPVTWPIEAEQLAERGLGKLITGKDQPIMDVAGGAAAEAIGKKYPGPLGTTVGGLVGGVLSLAPGALAAGKKTAYTERQLAARATAPQAAEMGKKIESDLAAQRVLMEHIQEPAYLRQRTGPSVPIGPQGSFSNVGFFPEVHAPASEIPTPTRLPRTQPAGLLSAAEKQAPELETYYEAFVREAKQRASEQNKLLSAIEVATKKEITPKVTPQETLKAYALSYRQAAQKDSDRILKAMQRETLQVGRPLTAEETHAVVIAKITPKVTPQETLKAFALSSRQAAQQTIRAQSGYTERLKETTAKAFEQYEKLFTYRNAERNYQFIDDFQHGREMTNDPGGKLLAVARALDTLEMTTRRELMAESPNLIEQYRVNYFPQLWKNPKKAEVFFEDLRKQTPALAKGFTKEKEYEYFMQGVKAGLEPLTSNPVTLFMISNHQKQKVLMAKRMIEELTQKGLMKTGEETTMATGWRLISPTISGTKNLYAAPEVARTMNNWFAPGLRGSTAFNAVRAYNNISNATQLFGSFHLAFVGREGINSQVSNGIMKMANEGKYARGAMDVVTAPLAPARNLYYGNKVLKEYFKPGSQGELIGKIVNAAVEGGAKFKTDAFYLNGFRHNFQESIRQGKYWKTPFNAIFGTIEKLASPIQEWYVPRMKAGAMYDLLTMELERHPNLSRDGLRQVAARSVDVIDNIMGQMNYDLQFYPKVVKDLGLVSTRSLMWNVGDVRQVGGGIKDWGVEARKFFTGKPAEMTPRMAYTLAMPVNAYLIGSAIHYLRHLKAPQDIYDGFFIPISDGQGGFKRDPVTGDVERTTLNSYASQVYGFWQHPLITLLHKAAPMWSDLYALISNKEYWNRKVYLETAPWYREVIEGTDYLARSRMPFQIESWKRDVGSGTLFGLTHSSREVEASSEERYSQMLRQESREIQRRLHEKPRGPISWFLKQIE